MFSKLKLLSKEEKFSFEENLNFKGEYLIDQIYDVLLDENKGNEVVWNDIVAILRFDKSLRDKLYIFLASFEEHLKAKILRRYDVANREIIYRRKNTKQLCVDIYLKEHIEQSNLYYCFELELGSIIELMENKQMFEQSYIDQVKIVKTLRNNVMHHQVLLLGKANNYIEALKEISNLEIQLQALYQLMPNDEYKSAFEKSLNEQIGRKYMNKIKLGEIKYGVFNKG